MKMLRYIGVFLIVIMVLILTGDYINLPLWPTDWLKTNYPVEVRLNLENVNPDETRALFKKSRYSKLELCDPAGERIRELHVDDSGIARFVVREGRYSFRAMVTALEGDDWISFVQQRSDSGVSPVVRFDAPGKVFILTLEKMDDLESRSKREILKVYLEDADLVSAQALAEKISMETARDVQALMNIRETLGTLPVSAYNSIIRQLQAADRLLQEYDIDPEERVLEVDGELMHVQSRLKAVEQARNVIIESYIQIMDQLQDSGRLIDVLEEWNQMTGNPELYDPEILAGNPFMDELKRFEDITSEVITMLPTEIRTTFDRSVQLYEDGELVEAHTRFTRLLTFIRNLNVMDDYEDMVGTIQEYIEDIEAIAAANHAIRSDDLNRAMLLFSSVARPNKMVFDRMDEIREFQRLRGIKVGSE